ncbi:MAG: ATP-dependent endonuclease [Deferribacterales bacterium]
MNLIVEINNIKSVEKLTVKLPLKKGLYAITGLNGSGKSTLISCASCAFFNRNNALDDYFGFPNSDSRISFSYNGFSKNYYVKDNMEWGAKKDDGFNLKGFYEGSLIYGNRFRNANVETLRKLSGIDESKLNVYNEFIRENLGRILQDDPEFYEVIYRVHKRYVTEELGLKGEIFCYKKNNIIINQFHMSTGENLLISILNSLHKRIERGADTLEPKLILLDEIELALHPSALLRLLSFIESIAEEYNFVVYFSTHSIELISSIRPENIYYLERFHDNSMKVINPCYPAYATRDLYVHAGFDYVILAEDELAKDLIDNLLDRNKLRSSKLVHVLPCGGYTNVITLAYDVTRNKILSHMSNIIIILDADVKDDAQKFIRKNISKNVIPLNYLPIKSLEKYLKYHLFDNVNQDLYEHLQDSVFMLKSLRNLIQEYKNSKEYLNDSNGKKLFDRIENELENVSKPRVLLINKIVEFLLDEQSEDVQKLVSFLEEKLK